MRNNKVHFKYKILFYNEFTPQSIMILDKKYFVYVSKNISFFKSTLNILKLFSLIL